MRNSKVLVINVGSLANEIIKNIVLAGIGSLTILDSNIVTESDLGAQFFLEESDVGKNVSTSYLLLRVHKLTTMSCCFHFFMSLFLVFLESRGSISEDKRT